MNGTVTLLLILIMLLSLFSTFFYSLLSRRSDGKQRGVYRAWMNLSMGLLFIALAIHLYMLHLSTMGNILATLILAVGLVNLYYGWKHKQYFSKQS